MFCLVKSEPTYSPWSILSDFTDARQILVYLGQKGLASQHKEPVLS